MTRPLAMASTGALSSSTSAWSKTCSSRSSMPMPVLEETGTNGESPPNSSGTTSSATSSAFDAFDIGLGLVDLGHGDDDRHTGRLGVV